MGEDGQMADSYESDRLANPDPDPRDEDARRAYDEQQEADEQQAIADAELAESE